MEDLDDVQARLGLDNRFRPWLSGLSGLSAPPVTLPAAEELRGLLVRLRIPAEDVQPVVDAAPTAGSDPHIWWLLERCVQQLSEHMGSFRDLQPAWPDLPWSWGPVARYFYGYVLLAALPLTRSYHAQRGIPDAVTWDTLADLGDKMAMHRRAHGVGGLAKQSWLTLHLRGGLYALGRLQFALADACEYGGDTDEAVLGVHIPGGGPMSPEACNASFRQAAAFFPTYFPEHRSRRAMCSSWLLDGQLAEYLPAASNILRFQQRFTLLPDVRDGDADILEFVFGRPDAVPEELSRGSILERAIASHLAADRHWRVRTGWCDL